MTYRIHRQTTCVAIRFRCMYYTYTYHSLYRSDVSSVLSHKSTTTVGSVSLNSRGEWVRCCCRYSYVIIQERVNEFELVKWKLPDDKLNVGSETMSLLWSCADCIGRDNSPQEECPCFNSWESPSIYCKFCTVKRKTLWALMSLSFSLSLSLLVCVIHHLMTFKTYYIFGSF